jgi:WD40 repeat protein
MREDKSMAGIDRNDSNLEERLRDHYQHHYEQPPDPTMVWARVLPHLDRQEKSRSGLVQRAQWLSGFLGRHVARQNAALKHLHEEHVFMQGARYPTQTKVSTVGATQGKPSLRRRIAHLAEAGIAAVLVAGLLISWFAIASSRNAQGTASGPLFSYTSQPGENIYYPEWTPDRQYLTFMVCGNQAEPSDGCRYQVWDAVTRRIKQTLTLPASASSDSGGITITDTPDGRYSLIVTWDLKKHIGTVKLVNILTGQIEQLYQGDHYSDVPVTTISNDSKFLAVVGDDGYVRVWDCTTSKIARTIDPGKVSVQQIGWSTDDTRIFFSAAVGNVSGLQMWNMQTGQRLANIVATPTMSLSYLSTTDEFSPDGQRVLTYNLQTSTFVVRDSSTLNVLQTLRTQLSIPADSYIMPMWLANGARILLKRIQLNTQANQQNQKAYIWNTETGQLVASPSLADVVHQVGIPVASPGDGEGQYISCLRQDNRLAILNTLTGATVSTISLTIDPQQEITWLPGDKYLSIVDQGKDSIQIYNALTGQLILSSQGDEAALSSDGKYLAVGTGLANRAGDTHRSTLQVFALH